MNPTGAGNPQSHVNAKVPEVGQRGQMALLGLRVGRLLETAADPGEVVAVAVGRHHPQGRGGQRGVRMVEPLTAGLDGGRVVGGRAPELHQHRPQLAGARVLAAGRRV